MLFKLQCHIEKYLKKLGLGPRFSSMSPLSLINLMLGNISKLRYIKKYQGIFRKLIKIVKNK